MQLQVQFAWAGGLSVTQLLCRTWLMPYVGMRGVPQAVRLRQTRCCAEGRPGIGVCPMPLLAAGSHIAELATQVLLVM